MADLVYGGYEMAVVPGLATMYAVVKNRRGASLFRSLMGWRVVADPPYPFYLYRDPAERTWGAGSVQYLFLGGFGMGLVPHLVQFLEEKKIPHRIGV